MLDILSNDIEPVSTRARLIPTEFDMLLKPRASFVLLIAALGRATEALAAFDYVATEGDLEGEGGREREKREREMSPRS